MPDLDPMDLVPARRKAGWPPVVIAAREDVIQPLNPCDCHPGQLLWHPGDVALVRRAELEGESARPDCEPVEPPSAPTSAPAAVPTPAPQPEAVPSNVVDLNQAKVA